MIRYSQLYWLLACRELLWIRFIFFSQRMLVHNEEDEDLDIRETFQGVFKPFWAGVPVVNDLLLHIKLLSDNFFIIVKNVESVLKPTASPSLSWSLSQFPCFMKWLVVLLLPLGDGVLVYYKVTPPPPSLAFNQALQKICQHTFRLLGERGTVRGKCFA